MVHYTAGYSDVTAHAILPLRDKAARRAGSVHLAGNPPDFLRRYVRNTQQRWRSAGG